MVIIDLDVHYDKVEVPVTSPFTYVVDELERGLLIVLKSTHNGLHRSNEVSESSSSKTLAC